MKRIALAIVLAFSLLFSSGCTNSANIVKNEYVFVDIGGGAKTLGKVVGRDETYIYVVTCAGANMAVQVGVTRTNFSCDSFKTM